ncbi:glycosyltransferase [Flavobacterium sp.]|uniref:glycosyltransferase n=1 Tax=Flavobacterium sp. TaxID=239 RepID=UPI003BC19578
MGISRTIRYYKRRIEKVGALENIYNKQIIKQISTIEKKGINFNSSEKPFVTILIPFYNEVDYTRNCLNFLYNNLTDKYPYEIILIDDNSSEDVDLSYINGIKILKNEENLGFLKNINKGIKAAKGDYVYLLNNDTEVQNNFLEELFFVFENFKNVGAVGSMLTNADGSLQEAGSLFMKDCDINQIVRKKLPFYPEVNYIYKVDYCSGCSLLFKKIDDSGNLNLLDEQFVPAYFEETDFCFQLKHIQNKDVYFTPFSKVLHYNGVTYNSKKNTDENKLKKKEELFKSNLIKFKEKWGIQLNKIKSTSIPDRIQEIYNNKSIVFFAIMIPEYDKDSGSNRLKEIIDDYVEIGFHVSLIVKFTYFENKYIEYFQRKGVNVFYEHKKYTSIEKYLEKQKLNPSIVWFYSPDVFIKYYKVAKKYCQNAKLVYDMVDIHHLRIQRSIEVESKRASLRKKYLKYKKIETQAAKLADYVIAISGFEENYMKQFCEESKLKIISNIHYPKIDINKTLDFEKRKDIIFIGSTHTPNIDAVRFLYNEIMPLVWNEIPDLNVNIIGNIIDQVSDIKDSKFIFRGYVPDIEDYFISNKLMVAPLRYGAGIKGKIGQSFEYYLPVVTTSIGAEGMNLTNYKNALINDSSEDFAKSIISLYTDKELWLNLQKNSEDSLEQFSKEHLKKIILQINI